jgi:hypothetical protein
MMENMLTNNKKSLKIPKGIIRRTDKIMAKGKGQTTISKTIHRKLKIEKFEPH